MPIVGVKKFVWNANLGLNFLKNTKVSECQQREGSQNVHVYSENVYLNFFHLNLEMLTLVFFFHFCDPETLPHFSMTGSNRRGREEINKLPVVSSKDSGRAEIWARQWWMPLGRAALVRRGCGHEFSRGSARRAAIHQEAATNSKRAQCRLGSPTQTIRSDTAFVQHLPLRQHK